MWSQLSLSTFRWVLGTEVRLLGLCGEPLHPLHHHLAGPCDELEKSLFFTEMCHIKFTPGSKDGDEGKE